jgi:hypothetical protein
MSHFTRVRTQLRELRLVKQTLIDLGFSVTKGKVRGYGNQEIDADLVVHADSGYGIGFRKEGSTITMVADFWGLKINREEFLAKISQRYAYLVVVEQAAEQGWQIVGEETQPDGSIRLVAQRWS